MTKGVEKIETKASSHPQVLIIGAGRGLGRSLALRFGREGHAVGLVARGSEHLEETAAEVRRLGVRVATAQADAADPARLADAVTELRSQAPIGVLIYNATMMGGPLSKADLPTLRQASDVNLHSPILAIQAALTDLEAHRGSVLVTGGGLALHPSPDVGILSIGKAMIRAAALILAADLAPRGVRVRTVTILGLMQPGGPFDPDRIAKVFWELHNRTDGAPEFVYQGDTVPEQQ